MEITPQQLDAIAFLMDEIRDLSTEYQNNTIDMEMSMMRIAAYSYAIQLVLEKVQ